MSHVSTVGSARRGEAQVDGPDVTSVKCGRMLDRTGCVWSAECPDKFLRLLRPCAVAAATVGWTRLAAVGAYAFAPEASFGGAGAVL